MGFALAKKTHPAQRLRVIAGAASASSFVGIAAALALDATIEQVEAGLATDQDTSLFATPATATQDLNLSGGAAPGLVASAGGIAPSVTSGQVAPQTSNSVPQTTMTAGAHVNSTVVTTGGNNPSTTVVQPEVQSSLAPTHTVATTITVPPSSTSLTTIPSSSTTVITEPPVVVSSTTTTVTTSAGS